MKNLNLLMATTIMLAMAGCMSMEERLQLPNEQVRRAAEKEIFEDAIAVDSSEIMMRAVERISDDEYLAQIAINSHRQGLVDGKMEESTIAAGVAAVKKIRSQSYLSFVHETARENMIRDLASDKMQYKKMK